MTKLYVIVFMRWSTLLLVGNQFIDLNSSSDIWCILPNLTLSWRRPISYRNQSIDLQSKSIDWFLYDIRLRHERVKAKAYAFILRYLYFLLRFFIKIRVPGWTRIIKMRLNKNIAGHSAKLFCEISIFPVKKF